VHIVARAVDGLVDLTELRIPNASGQSSAPRFQCCHTTRGSGEFNLLISVLSRMGMSPADRLRLGCETQNELPVMQFKSNDEQRAIPKRNAAGLNDALRTQATRIDSDRFAVCENSRKSGYSGIHRLAAHPESFRNFSSVSLA
jgi:hypothetical protein